MHSSKLKLPGSSLIFSLLDQQAKVLVLVLVPHSSNKALKQRVILLLSRKSFNFKERTLNQPLKLDLLISHPTVSS